MVLKNEHELESNGTSVVEAMAEQVEEVDALKRSIAETLDPVAQPIQKTIRRMKKHAKSVMETVADGIDNSTEYLTDRGMVGVLKDGETLIRRYPFQVLILGISVGFLLSRSRQR
jgi:ElaB/YqjD/DUF883 family membrane-anchored ribosome-binding protein